MKRFWATEVGQYILYSVHYDTHPVGISMDAQSRQSAKLFLQSSELGVPHPSPAGECAASPLVHGGRGTLVCGKGVGEFQFRRGAYTVVLFIYTYFVVRSEGQTVFVLCYFYHVSMDASPSCWGGG